MSKVEHEQPEAATRAAGTQCSLSLLRGLWGVKETGGQAERVLAHKQNITSFIQSHTVRNQGRHKRCEHNSSGW